MIQRRPYLIAATTLVAVAAVGLAIAWARLAPSPPADPASGHAGAPASGWRQGAFSAGTQTFYRPADTKGRLWVRYEVDGGPRRSQLRLLAFDCATHAVKSLEPSIPTGPAARRSMIRGARVWAGRPASGGRPPRRERWTLGIWTASARRPEADPRIAGLADQPEASRTSGGCGFGQFCPEGREDRREAEDAAEDAADDPPTS